MILFGRCAAGAAAPGMLDGFDSGSVYPDGWSGTQRGYGYGITTNNPYSGAGCYTMGYGDGSQQNGYGTIIQRTFTIPAGFNRLRYFKSNFPNNDAHTITLAGTTLNTYSRTNTGKAGPGGTWYEIMLTLSGGGSLSVRFDGDKGTGYSQMSFFGLDQIELVNR